jgi:hydroxymethylpyrimidine/phosphomethylpyrimidine kinase
MTAKGGAPPTGLRSEGARNERVSDEGSSAGIAPPEAQTSRVLTIASSDSGGGAGIQADLKAFARCGAHGMSAIVALTAQNTLGVTAIHEVPPAFARAQIDAVLDDIGADAAKTGMLFSAPLIEAVAGALAPRGLPLVVDPVMVASSGARLLREDAVETLIGRLFPLATVITPNLPEAQALTQLKTEDRAELAERLAAMGAPAVLITGGHGAEPVDHLFDGSAHLPIPVARYPVAATHGAGCTHSAALAASLAAGLPLAEAARRAAQLAGDAVAHGLASVGGGDGPVHVLHDVPDFPPAAAFRPPGANSDRP